MTTEPMTAPQNPRVTPRALAEVACTLSLTASEVCIDCETRKEAEEVLDWLEAHVGHREAAEAASKAREAALVEALERDAARLAHIQRKLGDGTLMTGTQRASFANDVWHMECEVREILAALTK